MNRYPRLAARLYNRPLLIHPSEGRIYGEILAARCAGLSQEEATAAAEQQAGAALSDRQKARFGVRNTSAGISIIPVDGTLVHRSLGMEPYSGMRAYEDIAEFVMDAATDPEVRGILLDIDSPGGEVAGIGALGDLIAEAAQVKPVWAAANDSAYSAAYWVASTANRFYVPRTGGAGSVGVILVAWEMSKLLEEEGYHVEVVTFGDRKAELNPYQPFTQKAIDSAQDEINRLGEMFVAHVAAQRGMSPDAVRATQAATFHGEHAVEAGLADAVGTLQDAHDDLVAHLEGRSTPRGTAALHSTHEEESMGHERESAEPAQTADEKETQVIDLKEAGKAAKMEDRAYQKQVRNLCSLAGKPELAESFIEQDVAAAVVSEKLIDLKAQEDEADAIHAGHEGVIPQAGPDVDLAKVSADVYGRLEAARVAG